MDTPTPQEIPNPCVGEYGYFLELHIEGWKTSHLQENYLFISSIIEMIPQET